jgi:phosphohistidine swiveling domain-containing protein
MSHLTKLMKRNISLLASDLFVHAWNDKDLFTRLTGFATHVSNFEFIDHDAWFDMDWFEEVIAAHWADGPEVFLGFTRRGQAAGERLIAYCRDLSVDDDDSASRVLAFWRSAKLLQDLSVFVPITHPLSLLFERKVRAILKAHDVPEAELDARLVEVSVPVKTNGPEQELLDLRRIKARMTDPAFDVEAAMLGHWREYAYLGYRDAFSAGYPLEFFRASLSAQDLDRMGIERAAPTGFRFSPQEQATIDLLKEFVWFRNYRTERFFAALYFLEPLWRQLSLDQGLGEHDIFYYLSGEVSRLFTHGERVPPGTLDERRQGSALLLDGDRFCLLTGDLLRRKEAEVEQGEAAAPTEIRGMVVCRGKARGRVAVVHDSSELGKVQEGDILVTGMTTPDYIPALRKAAAFVTDEGGVTCHAAIVARELKKPCIVGTKVATRRLTEGTLVEVDADSGWVRPLA